MVGAPLKAAKLPRNKTVRMDGYRAIAVVDSAGKARIWSRNRLPLEPKFPMVLEAVNQLKPPPALSIVRNALIGSNDIEQLSRFLSPSVEWILSAADAHTLGEENRMDSMLNRLCIFVNAAYALTLGTDLRKPERSLL
jgi:hypothetical protein